MSRIRCSKHYKQRFDERVTKKSKRDEIFAARAYYYGENLDDIEDKQLRNYIEAKQKIYDSIAKIYRGYVYWFCRDTAVTIYPIPRNFSKNVRSVNAA